jgi:hypothetical protein
LSELALRDEGILTRLGVERTATSLTLPVDLLYEDFEAIGEFIGVVRDASNWWLSEWLRQGEMLYGDKVHQAALLTKRAPSTLANIASIAHRIPPERRNPRVSFSVHAEVAALDPDAQTHWLTEAAERNLTRDELRSEIHAQRDVSPGVDILPPAVPDLREAASNVWHSSVRAVGDVHITPSEVMLEMKKALGE